MNGHRIIGRGIAAAIACLAFLVLPQSVHAVGPDQLGATFNTGRTDVTFQVFSSRATRMEVWIYDQPFGAAEKAKYELTVDTSKMIWSATISVADLQTAGVGETVYYGYRAWGPNWKFESAWTPGSQAGFISDVDDKGNRFNPNKLLVDPYSLEVSHDTRRPAGTSDVSFFSVHTTQQGHRGSGSQGDCAPAGRL